MKGAGQVHRDFIVPGDQEVFEAIGEWPEADEEGGARILTVPGGDGANILLSYDPLGQSVRVRWINPAGEQILDLFREGATRLTAVATADGPFISIEFDLGEHNGKIELQFFPHLAITDRTLFT
jgi:hypothetical protein